MPTNKELEKKLKTLETSLKSTNNKLKDIRTRHRWSNSIYYILIQTLLTIAAIVIAIGQYQNAVSQSAIAANESKIREYQIIKEISSLNHDDTTAIEINFAHLNSLDTSLLRVFFDNNLNSFKDDYFSLKIGQSYFQFFNSLPITYLERIRKIICNSWTNFEPYPRNWLNQSYQDYLSYKQQENWITLLISAIQTLSFQEKRVFLLEETCLIDRILDSHYFEIESIFDPYQNQPFLTELSSDTLNVYQLATRYSQNFLNHRVFVANDYLKQLINQSEEISYLERMLIEALHIRIVKSLVYSEKGLLNDRNPLYDAHLMIDFYLGYLRNSNSEEEYTRYFKILLSQIKKDTLITQYIHTPNNYISQASISEPIKQRTLDPFLRPQAFNWFRNLDSLKKEFDRDTSLILK
ncbi:MAG: hypothetical protein HWE07_14050 [Cytophagia bacterium]|nr:hypothetical protein [Cytophagia bacterium]